MRKAAVIIECLKEALEELRNRYGTEEMSRWTVKIASWNFGKLGTVPAYRRVGGGGYICGVEVDGAFTNALAFNFAGQSENPYSPHYADQLQIVMELHCRPDFYTFEQIKENLESEVVLTVP